MSFDEKKEDSITLEDILLQHQTFHEEVSHQLNQNWGNENACTYDEGYINQPVYGCKTCKKDERFGFCFGCSMNCHLEHEVFELFDKRNFRCDCGTPKSGWNCSFHGPLSDDNFENKYNHNFDHLYCWCNSSYNEQENVMYQCIICMDWFHLECIQKKESETIPSVDIVCDFICCDCVKQNSFLLYYYPILKQSNINDTESSLNNKEENKNINEENKGIVCKLENLKEKNSVQNTFWIKDWCNNLCRCDNCLKIYTDSNVIYLLEEKNSDSNEEISLDQKDTFDLVTASEQAFLNLPIPQENKIDLIFGYTKMVDGLKSYLKRFADTGTEVTKKDIDLFFQDIKKRKT